MAGTTTNRDYYEILGVSRDANEKEIERAYRRLALRYHPDRCKEADATAKFKEASEAYAVLSDPDKRRRYDRHGYSGVSGYSHEDLFGGIDLENILGGTGGFNFESNIFDRMFGFRTPPGPVPGANIEVVLHVPLTRILGGGKELIHVRRPNKCAACEGSGAEPGTQPHQCEACHGTGRFTTTRQDKSVRFQQITTCPTCQGRGILIEHPCSECHGLGQVEQDEKLEVRIPPGIDEGRALRIAGHGHPSSDPNGPPGDLYVVVHSEPNPRFQRHGPHIRTVAPITIADAVLGTQLDVPTLEGKVVELKVPPGTQPESVFRITGHGLPIFGANERGNLYVIVQVHIPKSLSPPECELFQQLRTLDRESKEVLASPRV